MSFTKDALQIDAADESQRIVAWMRETVGRELRRFGVVLGISGGVDSSVALALCVRAFEAKRVVALLLPERESSADTRRLSDAVARHFGVEPVLEDITAALEGFGCYARRDAAIRRVFPEYDPAAGYKAKIVLPPNALEERTLNVFSLTIVLPDGAERSQRLPPREFAEIVAATNFKQRTRMAMLYHHAELRNYAVVGTPNKNEHDQGFFVKHGDGGVDFKPIGHLYKTQVYQLARYLGVPEEILRRPPTSDTYSAPSTQEEFFFRLPFEKMDLLAYAQERGVPAVEAAAVLDLKPEQVQWLYDDLTRKRRTTDYLRRVPLGMEPPAV